MSRPQPHPVREILRDLGLSLAGVARRTGIDHQHLVRVVNGSRFPDHDTKIALVTVTGLPITRLFRLDCLADAYRLRTGRPPQPTRPKPVKTQPFPQDHRR